MAIKTEIIEDRILKGLAEKVKTFYDKHMFDPTDVQLCVFPKKIPISPTVVGMPMTRGDYYQALLIYK